MATSLASWMTTRGQRREMARALGVPPDYFEGMALGPRPEASDQDELEIAAYLEALMKVVAERRKNLIQGL